MVVVYDDDRILTPRWLADNNGGDKGKTVAASMAPKSDPRAERKSGNKANRSRKRGDGTERGTRARWSQFLSIDENLHRCGGQGGSG